jgi:PAS domain S-box-containing protein
MSTQELLNFLAVEDEPAMASMIKLLIKRNFKATVDIAGDCSSARESISSGKHDIIILDYKLPDGNGIELLAEITADPGHPPVIMVTGQGGEEIAAEACRRGVFAYVVKDRRLSSILPSTIQKAIEHLGHEDTRKALEVSEDKYRKLINMLSEGVLIHVEGKVVFANPAILEIFRAKGPDEVIGKPVLEFVDTGHRAGVLERLSKIAKGEGAPGAEERLLRLDGTGFDAVVAGVNVDFEGKPGVMAVIRETQEPGAYEEPLSKSEEILSFIAKNMEYVVFSVDMDLNVTYVSESVERVLGFTVAERMRQSPREQLTPESLELARTLVEEELENDRVAGNERTRVVELDYYHKDGSVLNLETTVSFIRDNGGKPVGIYGLSRDVSHERKAEKALRESEESMSAILNSVPALIFYKDRENRFIKVNKATADVLGLAVEEVEGKSISALFPEEEGKAYYEDDLEVMESGLPKTGIIEPMETPGGLRWLRTDKIPYRDPEGNTVGVIGFAVDVTEQKEYREELQRANRELERYARVVSHDLKGPLSAVTLGVDTLGDLLEGAGIEDSGAVSEVISTVGRSARKAEQRVSDLLELAKAGNEPGAKVPVDVGNVVGEALYEIQKEIREKGVEVQLSPDMGVVTGNQTQLLLLFTNLIRNSVRYNDCESPVLQVLCLGDDDEGRHRYLVRDNGPGIPEGIIEKVFFPFVTGGTGNTGIGLSVVESTVRFYGGEIKAYNDNGACFEFSLGDLG